MICGALTTAVAEASDRSRSRALFGSSAARSLLAHMPVVSSIPKEGLKQLLASIARAPPSTFCGIDEALLKAAAKNLAASAGGDATMMDVSEPAVDLTQLTGRGFVEAALKSAPLVVFSKTTCGFCARVKSVLREYTDSGVYFEVNQRADMNECQDTLLELTGGRSVPRVYVGGKFVGGCDETLQVHMKKELSQLLREAGVPDVKK